MAAAMFPIADVSDAITVTAADTYVDESESQTDSISAEPSADTGVTVEYEDMTITENISLDKDIEVNNLTIQGGTVNLNGHVLKVHKNIVQSYGTITYNTGSLYCYGDYTIKNSARVNMTTANDYLYVEGNLTWENNSYSYNTVTNGVIELKGDFIQEKYDTLNFKGYNRIIFSGEKEQNLCVNNKSYSLNIVELNNTSETGVVSKYPVFIRNLIKNESRFTIAGKDKEFGHVLEEDEVIEGDYELIGGVLDLAGHSLTINGDLSHFAGKIIVNNGTLIVNGNFDMADKAILYMNNSNDHIIVNGSFSTESIVKSNGCLTNGVMEVKGNFVQNSAKSNYNFVSTNNHKVVLKVIYQILKLPIQVKVLNTLKNCML